MLERNNTRREQSFYVLLDDLPVFRERDSSLFGSWIFSGEGKGMEDSLMTQGWKHMDVRGGKLLSFWCTVELKTPRLREHRKLPEAMQSDWQSSCLLSCCRLELSPDPTTASSRGLRSCDSQRKELLSPLFFDEFLCHCIESSCGSQWPLRCYFHTILVPIVWPLGRRSCHWCLPSNPPVFSETMISWCAFLLIPIFFTDVSSALSQEMQFLFFLYVASKPWLDGSLNIKFKLSVSKYPNHLLLPICSFFFLFKLVSWFFVLFCFVFVLESWIEVSHLQVHSSNVYNS